MYRYAVSQLKGYRPYGSSTYMDISGPEGYLARVATFKGRSMRGQWERSALDGRDLYVICSYDTAIAFYDPQTEERTFSQGSYGAITSFDQALCRAWLKGHNAKTLRNTA